MRRWDAFQIAKELNEKNRKIVSIAGWRIAAAWNCNLSEDELQKKSNTHFKAWYIYQARAAKKYKDITGDDISWM
jgi:G:T-mismatch repair DNA endonuclease (very short patch repair protein)